MVFNQVRLTPSRRGYFAVEVRLFRRANVASGALFTRETFPEMDLEIYKDVFAFKDSLEQSKEKLEFVEKYIADCTCEYVEKRKILYRAICDFISGMTDSYAINEYRKLLC